METKPRILYLLKILEQYTDEEHPLTTNQLIEKLNQEYGISAHRTTLAKDITALREFGIDIVTVRSTQSRYFIAGRKFELPELKLLIDAVQSSKFITARKSQAMIEKLQTLASEGQVDRLKRNNYVANRIKPDNEQIYYIVDTMNDAINENRQISFQYFEYTGSKEKQLKNNGEVYQFSPYHMLWNGDYYYVLGYSKKHGKITTFRVDRIAETPEVLQEESIPKPEGFDLAEFTKSVFLMYDGEKAVVELRCDNSVMKNVIDRFGEDVMTSVCDMASFLVQAEVYAGPTFFGWVFGFGGKVRILGPERVKEQYRQMVLEAYGDLMD